jgi:hypothetical protein
MKIQITIALLTAMFFDENPVCYVVCFQKALLLHKVHIVVLGRRNRTVVGKFDVNEKLEAVASKTGYSYSVHLFSNFFFFCECVRFLTTCIFCCIYHHVNISYIYCDNPLYRPNIFERFILQNMFSVEV